MPIYTIEINEKQHLKYPLAITISYAVTTLHVSLLLSATQCIILLLNGKYLYPFHYKCKRHAQSRLTYSGFDCYQQSILAFKVLPPIANFKKALY